LDGNFSVFSVEDGGYRFLGIVGKCLFIWHIQGITSEKEERFGFQDISLISVYVAETWTFQKLD
jgi:hypothetical protein